MTKNLFAPLITMGLCLAFLPVLAQAQDQTPSQNNDKPFEIHPAIKHVISPPLREVAPIPPSQRRRETDELHQLPLPPNHNAPNLTDAVLQSSTGKPMSASASGLVNIMGVGNDFIGPQGSYTVTSIPPDTNGAVGATQYVQWVNDAFAIFDKSTGAVVYGPALGNTLFQAFGPTDPCAVFNDGDPTAQYDKAAQRWVLTQFIAHNDGPPYAQCLAVSTTSDATGTYHLYEFQFSNFNDYGKLGVWPDGYYMAFNMFQPPSQGGHGLGAEVCAFDRSKMLAGQNASALCTQPDSLHFGLLPSDLDGATAPPAGSPNYFVNFGANSLNLWKFHADFTTPSNSTFTGPTNIPVAAFNPACNGGTCIPQPGTTQQLDSLADRLMYRLAYRNFGGHESLVVNHTVDAGGGRAGVRWYELRSPGTAPTVFQQGTFAPSDGLYRWMGSIAMDKAGNIAMGYSESSSSTFPSISVTGRVPGDPLGTMEAEASIFAGLASQDDGSGTVKRWGDYSAMTVDPSDDCTLWYTTEYIPFSGAFNWDTRIASLKFNTCGQVTAAPTVSSVSPTAGPTTGGNTVTINGTNFTSGAGVKFGTTASATVTFVSATQLTAVAPAHAAGTIDVTVTTPGGTSAIVAGDHYTYDAQPTLSAMSPTAGPTTGGNTVTINGTNFTSGAGVKFGTTASATVTFVSAMQLTAVAPAHAAGTIDVTVTTPGGTSALVAGDHYAYGSPTVTSFAPTSGMTGSTVTINGTGFVAGATVKFGTKPTGSVTFVSGTQIKAIVPNGAVTAKISVTTPAGTGTSVSNFTVTLSITGFSPATGPTGTVVTINGVGFNSSSTVKFNGATGSSVVHVSSTQLKATVPSTATTGPISVTNTTAPSGTVQSAVNYTKT